jgi:hypothetical protein
MNVFEGSHAKDNIFFSFFSSQSAIAQKRAFELISLQGELLYEQI